MIALLFAAMLAQAAPDAAASPAATPAPATPDTSAVQPAAASASPPPQVADPAQPPTTPSAPSARPMGPGPDADDMLGQRIGASYQAVEALQGPLDGSWTLVAASDGRPIFAFQLVDRPGGRDPLEGMWRDLRQPAVAGDINPIDALQRGGASLTITIAARVDAPADAIALTLGADGAWTGQLTEAGQVTQVRLRRS